MALLYKVLMFIRTPEGKRLIWDILRTLAGRDAVAVTLPSGHVDVNIDIMREITKLVDGLTNEIQAYYETGEKGNLLSHFMQHLSVMGFVEFDDYMRSLLDSPIFEERGSPFDFVRNSKWKRDTRTQLVIQDMLPIASWVFNEIFEWEYGPEIMELIHRFFGGSPDSIQIARLLPYIWELVIRNHNNEPYRPPSFDLPTGQVLMTSDYLERRRRGRDIAPLYIPEDWETDAFIDEDEIPFRVFVIDQGPDMAYIRMDWRTNPPSPRRRHEMVQDLLFNERLFSAPWLFGPQERQTLSTVLHLAASMRDPEIWDLQIASLRAEMNDAQFNILQWLLEDNRWRTIERDPDII